MGGIGRNDPCPCGSGKKYKNCCLSKDRARRIRASSWRHGEKLTLEKLIAFTQRPEFSLQLAVAFNLFWNGHYGFEGLNALNRDEMSRFLDWYMHDYRLEESRKRIIELFIEELGAKMLPDERERVYTWRDSYLSLYWISGLAEEGVLAVVDDLQKVEERVWDDGLGRLGLPGDLILGRILRSSHPPHFSWAAILLPAEMRDGLTSFIKGGYRQYLETHIQASWSDFLSNYGYMFNHYLLRSAAEAGKARYATKVYYDAYETLEKLGEVERRLQEQAARRAEEQWGTEVPKAEEERESLRQTKGGILLPSYVSYKGSKELK